LARTEKRKAEAERIRQKYADRIPVSCGALFRRSAALLRQRRGLLPFNRRVLMFGFAFQVICEKAEKSDIPTIDKKKYLVPALLGSLVRRLA